MDRLLLLQSQQNNTDTPTNESLRNDRAVFQWQLAFEIRKCFDLMDELTDIYGAGWSMRRPGTREWTDMDFK